MDRTFRCTRETELLILCSRIRRTEQDRHRVRALVGQGVNWEKFLQRAVQNKLYPLVFQTLNEDASGSVPSEVLSRLRSWVMRNAARNETLCQTLGLILDLFEKHGVDGLTFKGPLLSLQVYGSPFLRVFSDLDILVPKDQAIMALDLLAAQGFTADFLPGRDQVRGYLENENFFRLTGQGDGIVVDLHWEMSGKYGCAPMMFEGLAGELAPARFMDRPVRTLRPAMLVVYLCIHNSSHLWDSLESAACLAGLLGSSLAPDGRSLMDLARKYRAVRVLLTGLRITEILYRAHIPRMVKEAMNMDLRVEKIARNAVARLLDENLSLERNAWGWRFAADHLRVRDTPLDALNYAGRLLFRPTVKEWMHFPDGRFSNLRFVLRPFRLALAAFQRKKITVS